MEDRDLTFSPAINRNSSRIVDRLRGQGGADGAATAGAGAAAGAGAVAASTTASSRLRAGGGAASKPGRSWLPGHEQETFQPRINERSRALHRADGDVYSRL
jgi:hypothetical protein